MDLKTLSLDQILDIPYPSYHKLLELARTLARSAEPADRESATLFLERLARRYPHVLAIGQELVFVLMERGEHEQAESTLRDFEERFSTLDEEFLCRWGRLFKEQGDAHISLSWSTGKASKDSGLAERYYRNSLEKYDQAYRIREGHYPGINKATMLLILGTLKARRIDASARFEMASSAELAGKILASRDTWRPEQPDDKEVWFPATEGEAHLLREEWAEAADRYREALRQKKPATSYSRESMHRQVERIILCYRHRGISPPEPFDDIESFFTTEGRATLLATGPIETRPPLGPPSEQDPGGIFPPTSGPLA